MSWSQRVATLQRRRRRCVCLAFGVVLVFLTMLFAHPTTRPFGYGYVNAMTRVVQWSKPPTYKDVYAWEAHLPQHDLDLPFPEGRSGRYVKFSNEFKFKVGWNNCLNERLMNAHLAYMSKRAYVFTDYFWTREHYPWSPYPLGGAHTPMSAIVSGPLVGGPWEPGDDAQRAISERWWNVVCPPAERRIIRTVDVKPAVASADGTDVFSHWQRLLEEAPDRCIEVVEAGDYFPQTFDLGLFGSTRVMSLLEVFRDSPTSRLLGPSPIVQSAVYRNEYLFLPRGPRPPSGAWAGARDPFARTLAIHLRRGDYLVHCQNLAAWGSTYYSWAQLPVLVDKFDPPEGEGRMEWVMQHCLPNMQQVVARIDEVRKDYVAAGTGRVLDVLYLLTNEEGKWLEGLKAELAKAGWHTIATTRDLRLDAEQTDVSMAVDMEFARKAAVFVGNGWSSFTSNIIHQRLVDGREPLSIRLT